MSAYSRGLNYALYQAGWFACILGAAWGWPWTGAAIATALIAVHLLLAPERATELRLIGVALACGLVVEGYQAQRGTYAAFTSGSVVAWMSPPWLLLMWAQFATTFRWSLRGIMLRPVRAALFGAAGGPIAFWAGERLGAVTLATPLWAAYLRLGLTWGIALWACAEIARRQSSPSTNVP